jgi:RNA polymerase sigma-70 factor, ECF subfamily
VIKEALGPTHWQVGFRSGTDLDDSPETMSKTRMAVVRAKEGDHEALRFLYVSYADNVYGYARSIVHDDHAAEDITQQVFAKLMTRLVTYNDRGVPFFAWLLRLTRNISIDYLRADRLTPVETVLDPETSCGGDLDRTETVRVALAMLPQKQREVMVLRHVAGYTPEEIAARMGRTRGSVHGLHYRGSRTLQRELARLHSCPSTRTAAHLVAA